MGPALLATQLDASKTTLGDIADLGSAPILEFTVYGAEKTWMRDFIPGGIKVTVPGYMVVGGAIAAILASVIALSTAKTSYDFLKARRQLANARPKDLDPELAEAAAIASETMALHDLWLIDFKEFIETFKEENDRVPTQGEINEWIGVNPEPEAPGAGTGI